MTSRVIIASKKIFFPLALIFLSLFISFRNYLPSTYLLGWDSLHPEFNFQLAFERAFSGVWRQDQGIGALAAHSHMSDLPRIIFLWLELFFLPESFLRYSYIFLTIILGPLGFYFLFNFVFNKNSSFWGNLASFLASAYYLLNLITLQHFFVPFEMFCAQFAFLPWIFLFALKYLEKGDKKDLLFFCLISFFASPQAYASALYWAFLAGFSLFLATYFILHWKDRIFGRIFIIFILQLLVNLYWLAPNIYSAINGSSIIVDSKVNRLFSPEAFIRNEEYGTLKDIVLGKNFLFDWRSFDFGSNTFADLMSVWNIHLQKPYVVEVGYIIFVFFVFGMILSFIKRNKTAVTFLPIIILSLFFLQNLNGPFGFVYQKLIDNFEIFKEGFRMPFTKFSILYQFAVSLYFGALFFYLFDFLGRLRIFKFLNLVLFSFVFSSLVYFSLPMFNGYLISDVVKRKLPSEYLGVFDFFDKNNFGRVAVFPVYTLWGWEYHNWEYEGSGFLGFGIKDPLLVRDYDRWSPYNETFYNEASNILYRYYAFDKDRVGPCPNKKECEAGEEELKIIEEWNRRVVEEFENVLAKYQVSYLLLDESIINAGGDNKLLYIPEIKDLISKSSRIKEVARFGFLTIYHFEGTGSDTVQAPQEYSLINADSKYSKYDPVYQRYGDYISDVSSQPSAVSFPFVNFDSRGPVKIQIIGSNIEFLNKDTGARVVLPVNEKIEEKFDQDQGFKEGYNCDLKKKGQALKSRLEKGNFYAAYDGGVSCDWFYYPSVDRSKAYVLKIKGQNLKGRSLKVYLQNLRTGRMDLEELLTPNKDGKFDSYFVILPSDPSFEELKADNRQLFSNVPPGYILNVETRSFGRIASENIIEDITFIPIDIDWLYQITGLSGREVARLQNSLKVLSFRKYGTWGYKVEFENKDKNDLLVLGQGHDNGWLAVQLKSQNSKFKIEKAIHVKFNGWANGWIVQPSTLGSQPSVIYIFYWPQVLEWIGFVFLGIVFLALIIKGLCGLYYRRQV